MERASKLPITIADVNWKCRKEAVQTFLTDKPGLTGVKKSGVNLSPKSAGAEREMESMYFSASNMKRDNAIPQSPKALSVESVYLNEAEAIEESIDYHDFGDAIVTAGITGGTVGCEYIIDSSLDTVAVGVASIPGYHSAFAASLEEHVAG